MKIKNVLAYMAAAFTLCAGVTPAQAGKVYSLPYSQDFENVGDVTHTDSVWGENPTPLDCVFYAQGDELTVGVDEENPEYGIALKHISKGNKEKFIGWELPNQTSGVVAISLDLRHNDARMIYLRFSRTTWDPIVQMDNKQYTLIGRTEKGEYSNDEWYNVQLAVNLDEKLRTVSFAGDEHTSDFVLASLNGFYIQMQPDTEPASGFNEIFVDNLKIEKMDSEADVKLYSGEEEINGFTGVTDEIYLKIADSDSDVISSLSEDDIILTDLGDNPIAVEENDVELTTSLEDGKLKLKLNSELKDGHRYRLILPEDAKTRFTRNLSETEFEFSVGADGGAAAGAANLSRVIFTDADENADVYIKGSKLAPATKSIALYFSGSINEESLEDITVSNGDENEDFDISYSPDSNLCVLTLDNYLKANSEYEIIIPESVTGQEIKGSFVTDSGAYEVKTIEFLDASGNKTENISSAKNLKVSIINTLGESKKLSMVYSSHEGYYLKNMSFKNMEITPDIRKAEFIMPINAAENATKLQGFLVSDIKSVVPQNGYVQIGG